MCDRCILRERAYNSADPETRTAVDALDARTAETLSQIMVQGMLTHMQGGDDSELHSQYEETLISTGEQKDLLLGLIAPPEVPDSIPDDWT